MLTGKVMRFDPDRGYGFVRPDQGGPDLFMHISELGRSAAPGDIHAGTLVSYEEEDNGRGPKAVRVKVIGGADPGLVISEKVAAAIWSEASQAGYEAFIRVLHDKGWL